MIHLHLAKDCDQPSHQMATTSRGPPENKALARIKGNGSVQPGLVCEQHSTEAVAVSHSAAERFPDI